MADDSFAAFMSFVGDSGSGSDVNAGAAGDTSPSRDSKPNDDEYSYEEEQEREAMMKSYHHPMKQWFRQDVTLTTKYGQYPLFWQDLKAWAPYREVLKEFLRVTENGDKSVPSSNSAAATTVTVTGTTTDTTSDSAKTDAPTAETPEATSTEPSSAAVTEDDLSAPKRRRKSRWGEEVVPPSEAVPSPAASAPPTGAVSPSTAVPPSDAAGDANGERRRKKSRWAPTPAVPSAAAAAAMAAAAAAVAIPANLRVTPQQQQSHALRAQLDAIAHKLTTVSADAARLEKDPSRSPSPPPQYDNNGKRTNTREVRMRAALEKRRQQVIEELVKVNPLYRPPADYARQKLTRKIYIPIKDYPGYNFIGLIIGPRGNTQKRMEKESNCKIAIRGKGSVKEGSRGKKSSGDENDDLHVLITAEREDDLERAAKDVQALLVPIDDTKNAHKQKQLRELALINGTLRDDDFCHLCGEKGHRQFECPNREQYNTFRAANVRCAICGDSSHPTRDCTQKRKSAAETAAIDAEYNSFLQQLGEKPVISTASAGAAGAPAPTPTPMAPSTGAPPAPAAPAPAPWLQPAKVPSSTTTQPWMLKQSVGAPGTASVPGIHPASGPPALGSTPETAFPPAVAPSATAYGYPAQQQQQAWGAAQHQQQQHWGAEYYYGAASTEYQQYAQYGRTPAAQATTAAYGHYGPPPGAAAPPHVAAAGATSATGAAATPAPTAAASAANYYQQYQQHQQQQYYSHPPQQ